MTELMLNLYNAIRRVKTYRIPDDCPVTPVEVYGMLDRIDEAQKAVYEVEPTFGGCKLDSQWELLSRQRHADLCGMIGAANTAYYDNADPIMPDSEYDVLMRELREIERNFPAFVTPESPTQRVQEKAVAGLGKIRHEVPMKSLRDIFTFEELARFYDNVKDYRAVGARYVVEPKIDGLSAAVVHVDGKLQRGESRGDGEVGNDITANITAIPDVPKTLPAVNGITPRKLIVRGEVYIPRKQFEALNEAHRKNGGRIFANARNAASGILMAKNPGEDVKYLRFFAFDILAVEGLPMPPMAHDGNLSLLVRYGFHTVPRFAICGPDRAHDLLSIIKVIKKIGKERTGYGYDTDGAVVKVNSIPLQKAIGETSKDPKWAVAFKYPPEQKQAVIRDIVLQTGRTGKITPVAVFDPPVPLAGTMVSKASLHNQANINRLGLNVGSTVMLHKAAEIIPEVVSVATKGAVYENRVANGQPGEFQILACTCPSCGEPLYKNEAGTEEYCVNPRCPAQKTRLFSHFVSRECMDIRGVGGELISAFIERGWLNDLPDVFRLKDHRAEMETLPGFGPKQADNILRAVEDAKSRDLPNFIKALGLPGVGKHIGKELCRKCRTMDEIMALTKEEMESLDGVGPTASEAMRAFFDKPETKAMMEDFKALGVNMESKTAASGNTALPLSGLTFCITGTLSVKRSEMEAKIESLGGKCSGSVSKKTSYLLAGTDGGSKLDKAASLNVQVITEGDFKRMIGEG